ncbi:MAG: ATP phosphoribosyltransferase regulatory subunit [Gammaproteobacteria bacterium]|jgi:ATP phosphoribosyltransferase regulatory subunit|nr:ATP phosphoribosyltransferase regulatory subunit [Gammaproteobacteria bacterium]MBT3860290.1 ATP phosphoribosyltransferase regulatory subunit [Gammaproteobacteria bacterium]MBT3987582.1 ATP phosphoribosyltransferase regulatory subunit [Gammaproteobacteria bacterium]MBT4254524.1 ATP phosphoribosyltransferase regulatory subunit [Gammaproteobacteria bacterium]MBT4581680.1 ATP phosphoribosyltransferase regulatory subunit [Gammaproteobacteria bacterium]
MSSAKRWLLPDGVEEILPQEARKLESLRRQLLNLYDSWGYQLVITPLIEFLDSLLVGSSHDLDLHTFKITDQMSGRMMGIRADITPQAARIDAHCLSRQGPVRLCYADSVLHTKPRGLLSSRVPIRVGAELYGHAGVECDIELICLMHETLRAVDIADVHVVLGHVGIFRTLVQEAQLDESTERDLFEALQRKAYDEIDGVLAQSVKDESLRGLLTKLSRLSGDEATLQEAVDAFANAPAAVQKELQELVAIVEGVKKRVPDIVLCFDLCELSGYEYHTGIVFAAYTPDHGRAVAKGGRYDHIGEVFGRSRPASGFDSDLKTLAKLSAQKSENPSVVMAPSNDDPNLVQLVADLRGEGIIVVSNLNSEAMSADELNELNCDKHIVQKDGKWQVENL